jgi:hypothetical protein
MTDHPLELHLPRERAELVWTLYDVPEKLSLRDSLPGAHVFDRIAEGLKHAAERDLPLADRLAFALPASWMVNAKAPSPVLRAWRSNEALPAWELLVERLEGGPADWLRLDDNDRQEIGYALEALVVPPRGGLCALSKVLALLCPRTVPLLDDAAIALLTGGVELPADADHPAAGPEHLVPALDAFCRAAVEGEATLATLADAVPDLTLSPGQVLDRLLWVDSWGHRHFGGELVCTATSWSVKLPAASS